MKAVRTLQYGSPEVMEVVDIPVPEIGADQILVHVRASSVNPVDWKVRRGDVQLFSGWKPPQVLGADFAGEVEKLGEAAVGYEIGQKVYGMVRAFKGGAYAEYVVTRPEEIAPMPSNVTFEQAAVLPLVALTVHQLLFDRALRRAEQRVLVNGCTGGIGHIAVQMAKSLGFDVTGVCSARNLHVAKRLGADHVVDYNEQSPLETEQRYDLVFDAVPNLGYRRTKRILTSDGVYVSSLATPGSLLMAPILNRFRRRKNRYLWVAPDGEALRQMSELVDAGKLVPIVAKVYGLDEIRDAHIHSESGRVVGKLALRV